MLYPDPKKECPVCKKKTFMRNEPLYRAIVFLYKLTGFFAIPAIILEANRPGSGDIWWVELFPEWLTAVIVISFIASLAILGGYQTLDRRLEYKCLSCHHEEVRAGEQFSGGQKIFLRVFAVGLVALGGLLIALVVAFHV
jgi:hypothetical protein